MISTDSIIIHKYNGHHYYAVKISTDPGNIPLVTWYRAEWRQNAEPEREYPSPTYTFHCRLAADNNGTTPKKVSYADIPKSLFQPGKDSEIEIELQLFWISAERVSDSLNQFLAGIRHGLRINQDGASFHTVWLEPFGFKRDHAVLEDLNIWRISLSKNTTEDSHHDLTYYRLTNRQNNHGTRSPGNNSYFFLTKGTSCKSIEVSGGIKYLLADSVDEIAHSVLYWEEEKAPQAIIDAAINQFKIDGLARLACADNSWGLVDEKAFKESIHPGANDTAEIGTEIFYLGEDARNVINGNAAHDCQLLIFNFAKTKAGAYELCNIGKAYGRPYDEQDRQTLKSATLAKIGQKFQGIPLDLLSNVWIAEHCAQCAEPLTKAIIDKLLECELHCICDKARRHIFNNLHDFTYTCRVDSRKFSDLLGMPWLEKVMGGVELTQRNVFYEKILQHSNDTYVKDRCAVLSKITSKSEGFGGTGHYEELIRLVEEYFQPDEIKKAFLLLFDFLGKHFISGIPPSELPPGTDGNSAPRLDLPKMDPVLLKSLLKDDRHLGIFDRRVKTVYSELKEYQIGTVRLRIAQYIEDVRSEHLTDSENALLQDILACRAPLHERRVLQLLGVPCRQAIGDVFLDRMTLGRHLIPFDYAVKGVRNFQSRDAIVVNEIKEHRQLGEKIANLSLDALDAFLAEKRQFNLLGKMVVLSKISSFSQKLDGMIMSTVEHFELDLRDQCHLMAAAICNTVLRYAGKGADENKTVEECKNWVSAFWKEIIECFPDQHYGNNEKKNEDFSWHHELNAVRNGNIFKEKSHYTQFVLASMYDRQITTFYEPGGRFLMPYDAMVWAIHSVHRLHMMSALLPMCCGDWVCTHSKEDAANDNQPETDRGQAFSRRIWWDYRLAAVARKSGHRLNCCYKECHHPYKEAALQQISLNLGLHERTVDRHLQKIGWWYNGLADENLHSHFRCSVCGSIMFDSP